MKIDFNRPDSPLQIQNLQSLLQLENPTKEELATALFLILGIFYKNRPGCLSGETNYSISGFGCHNPTSEKTNKTLWGVMRYEITIESKDGFKLNISNEHIIGGFLKATFLSNVYEWMITSDVFLSKKNIFSKKRDIIKPKSVKVVGDNKLIMRELKNLLVELLVILEKRPQVHAEDSL